MAGKSVTVGDIRKALANLPDDADFSISIDVSRHGETEDEASRRAYSTEFYEVIVNQHRWHSDATMAFGGYLNDEV